MMDKLFALSLGFAALALATNSAFGQTMLARQCSSRAQVLDLLSETYRETRQGVGLAGGSSVVELFTSSETGSWTVTVTLPDGRTCLVASGTAWEATREEVPARGDPV